MLEVVSSSAPGKGHPFEDRVLVDEKRGLFAVADGATNSSQGTGAGAAELAVKLLNEIFTGDLLEAMTAVHEILYRRKKEDWSIGETTLTAVSLKENQGEVSNVGNSPALLIQGANITSLYTNDTSLDGGQTQLIGLPEKINIHTTRFQLQGGDWIIVASDGVEHALRPPLIYHSLMKTDAKGVADEIIRSAEKAGRDDDKAVVVIRVLKS